jgi:hypothetical protein
MNKNGRPQIYPWHQLMKKGDKFIWPHVEDANRIRSAAKNHFKVSVKVVGNEIYVVRLD